MGHTQEPKAQPHSRHNSFSLVFPSGKYGDSDQHAAPVSALPAPEATLLLHSLAPSFTKVLWSPLLATTEKMANKTDLVAALMEFTA